MKSFFAAMAPVVALAWTTGASAQIGPAPAQLLTVQPAGGTSVRLLGSKLGDALSVLDFGAKCDGVTDDSTAIVAASLSGKSVSVPAGTVCNAASVPPSTLTGSAFVGPGQIKTSDGAIHAPLFAQLTQRPARVGNWSAAGQAFDADMSRVFAQEYLVSGAATLGQPASGYQQDPSLSPQQLYFTNDSGWNTLATANAGRTGIAGRYGKVVQLGQGDASLDGCFGYVNSVLPGATTYLQNPAVECFGGSLLAFSDGAYVEFFGDADIGDNGHDIAAAGSVLNFTRTNATGNLGTNWVGVVEQSLGTVPIDAFIAGSGQAGVGIDWSGANLSTWQLGAIGSGASGSGYAVGDVLSAVGGTPATTSTTVLGTSVTKFRVTAIGPNGAMASAVVANAGYYATPPVSGYGTITLTGGHGTGATLGAQYNRNIALLLPAGTGGCIAPALTSGLPSRLVGLTNEVCVSSSGITLGNPANPAVSESDTGVTITVPVTVGSHLQITGSQPTVTSCGTSTVEYGSTDNAGAVDLAGSPASCTLVFAKTFATALAGHPFCTFTPKGVAGQSIVEYGDTATSVVFAWASSAGMTNAVTYHCD